MNEIDFSKEVRTAIKSNDLDRVVALIGSDQGRLNLVTPFGTWLHIAARHGSLDIVKRLVEMGADINKKGGTFDAGPMNLAISYGHIEVVKHLLSRGAEFDLSEPFRNPLFGAIYNNHLPIVKLLIEHGIDIRIKYTGDIMKNTDALAYAKELGRKEIYEYLAPKYKIL